MPTLTKKITKLLSKEIKPLEVIVSLMITFCLVGGITYALNTATTGYQVGNGATVTIDAHGVCNKVTNNSGSSYFVPTGTASEWSTFRSNLPSGITLGSCCAANYGQSCIPDTCILSACECKNYQYNCAGECEITNDASGTSCTFSYWDTSYNVITESGTCDGAGTCCTNRQGQTCQQNQCYYADGTIGCNGTCTGGSYKPINTQCTDWSIYYCECGGALSCCNQYGKCAYGTCLCYGSACSLPSDGGGGSIVICTELRNEGYISNEKYELEGKFGREHFSEVARKGYHAWGIPFVRMMRQDEKTHEIAVRLTDAFYSEIMHRLGLSDQGSETGKLLIDEGIPLCERIGTIVDSVPDYRSLFSSEFISEGDYYFTDEKLAGMVDESYRRYENYLQNSGSNTDEIARFFIEVLSEETDKLENIINSNQ